MRTVEIDEEVLEKMFENMEYLHSLVGSVLKLLTAGKSDDLLTTAEAAKLLRISVATLWNLKAYGKIPFVQINGRILYQVSDIAAYLFEHKINAP